MLVERLKKAREAARMSQADLAREVGVTPGAYSYFESGDRIPSLSVVKQIAKTLGVSIDYLVGLKEASEVE